MLSMEVRWPQGGCWLAGPSFLRHDRKRSRREMEAAQELPPNRRKDAAEEPPTSLSPTPLPTRKKLTGEKFSKDEGSKAGYQ